MKRTDILAVYLSVLALLQIGLYFVLVNRGSMGALLYLDPRLGIDAWLTGGKMSAEARSSMTVLSQEIRWIAATWILGLGLLLTFRKPVVKLYVVSECLLSLPTLAFFGMVILANLSQGHGFSIGELFFPLVVFSIYTIAPLYIALQDWRKGNEQAIVPEVI